MLRKLVLLLLSFFFWVHVTAYAGLPNKNPDLVQQEIKRLSGVLTALKLPVAEQESIRLLLSRSERAIKADHFYLSLHILQYAAATLAGYEFQHTHDKTQSVLEQEWHKLGPLLAARQRKLNPMPRMPLAVQAVVERSLTQVQPNYQASLMYGQEAGVDSGLFYLGLAQGNLEFVAFCRTLKFDPPAPSVLRAPAAELATTESDVLAAYRQFDTPAQHSNFIRVNSALKMAQDLARERRNGGVWLQVLEARRALVGILVKEAENRSAADLRTQSETVRAQLTKSTADHSLGWLYWQMAEAALATDDLKQANAILHHVLPRYFQSLARNKS